MHIWLGHPRIARWAACHGQRSVAAFADRSPATWALGAVSVGSATRGMALWFAGCNCGRRSANALREKAQQIRLGSCRLYRKQKTEGERRPSQSNNLESGRHQKNTAEVNAATLPRFAFDRASAPHPRAARRLSPVTEPATQEGRSKRRGDRRGPDKLRADLASMSWQLYCRTHVN
eukprot:6193709-Pleurochrysis_carterae.AAC.8